MIGDPPFKVNGYPLIATPLVGAAWPIPIPRPSDVKSNIKDAGPIERSEMIFKYLSVTFTRTEYDFDVS